jgi:hypothetical protein
MRTGVMKMLGPSMIALVMAGLVVLAAAAAPKAEAAGPNPEFSLAAKNRNCDTNPLTVKPDTCRIPIGASFTAQVWLDKVAGMIDVDGDTVAGWDAVVARVLDSAGLTLNRRPYPGEVVNCTGGIAHAAGDDGDIHAYCDVGLGNERLDTGLMFEIDYTCGPSGAELLIMAHGTGINTSLAREDGYRVFEANATEVLIIDCAFVWDVTLDGVVSASDISRVVRHYGQTVPPAAIENDVTGDGVVSAADIGEVVAHYGQYAP